MPRDHGSAVAATLLLALMAACAMPAPAARNHTAGDESSDGDAGNKSLTAKDPEVAPAPASAPGGWDAGDPPDTTKFCADPDLLMCFSFEDEVKDGSKNALAPTVQGVKFGPGKMGKAAMLADASFIRFASAPLLTQPATTIEAWVQPAAIQDESVVFDADERYAMSVLPGGSLRCITAHGAVSAGNGAAIPSGAWTHIACVFDGAEVRAYIGGILATSGRGGNGTHPTASAAIGGNAPSGQPFVGALDSLRVFKVARSGAQIAAAAAGN